MIEPAASKRYSDERREAPRVDAERFHRIVENAPEIIIILDADLVLRYVNPAVEWILGYQPEEVVGTSIYRYLHPEENGLVRDGFVGKRIEPESFPGPMELRLRHSDGSWRYVEVSSVDLLDDDAEGVVAYLHDVTEHKVQKDALAHRAFHDSLTGLPNRALFMDRLEHALVRAARKDKSVVIFFLDLDGFKAINDSFGHEAGDRVLVEVSRRLQSCLRPGDTVARLGGDEFAVLLEDASDVTDAAYIAERMLVVLRSPVTSTECVVLTTASIGIASSNCGLDRAEDLLRAADAAMYRVKERGKDHHEILEESISAEDLERLRLENDLRCAMERGELKVYYQPEVLLGTSRIVGMEALLRWEYPRRGLVPPSDFVGLAEENGLIVPIGRWILKEACKQALLWKEQYPDAPPLVSVNVSLRQFHHSALAETVAAVLRETGLDPRNLVLEVTESLAVENPEHVIGTLRKLKALGVKLAIDDFGAGYSSLSALEKFPVDFLKMDRAFVDRLGRGECSAPVFVHTLIDLAQALGIKVVAEGVENAEQLEELRRMECDLAQGFYFWHPLPEHEASDLLRSNRGT